jgi:hypothetical protein
VLTHDSGLCAVNHQGLMWIVSISSFEFLDHPPLSCDHVPTVTVTVAPT